MSNGRSEISDVTFRRLRLRLVRPASRPSAAESPVTAQERGGVPATLSGSIRFSPAANTRGLIQHRTTAPPAAAPKAACGRRLPLRSRRRARRHPLDLQACRAQPSPLAAAELPPRWPKPRPRPAEGLDPDGCQARRLGRQGGGPGLGACVLPFRRRRLRLFAADPRSLLDTARRFVLLGGGAAQLRRRAGRTGLCFASLPSDPLRALI